MKDGLEQGTWWRRALGVPAVICLAGEWALRQRADAERGGLHLLFRALRPVLNSYASGKAWAVAHWWLFATLAVSFIPLVFVFRRLYQWWHNVFLAALTGTRFEEQRQGFPKLEFDLIAEIGRKPPGTHFVGLAPDGSPVTIEEDWLNKHMHIVGPTGCGKTESLIFSLLLQDAIAGKGAAYVEAKGAQSAIERFKAIAALARRPEDVRIFSLEFPHHSYNPVYLSGSADPLATAERVFSEFTMDNEYYRGQAKLFFYNLVRLMAGTGKPFNLIDVRMAVDDDEVLAYVMDLSDDVKAKHLISKQLSLLGKKRLETFTGLCAALSDYDPGGAVSEALNSYAPDIVLEDAVEERQLVYFHLSANRYKFLAPAVGKTVLRHLASVGAARDARPEDHDMTPFSVSVDECQNFLSESLLKALTMLRSAKIQMRLSHQTPAQLEDESIAYERIVRINTRTKMVFASDDPDYLDLVSRTYGTVAALKKTVRFSKGLFWTHINTGETSNREVQEFRVHPDALKSLAAVGQGYLLRPDGAQPLSLAPLPPIRTRGSIPARKAPTKGLGLYEKFVEIAPELAFEAPNSGIGTARSSRRSQAR